MDVREHLERIVHPNMAELREGYGDVRLAFNAIAALDAFAGHLYHWCCTNASHEISGIQDDGAYRHRLALANADFALVRDMAKAQKHIHLTRGSPQVSGAPLSGEGFAEVAGALAILDGVDAGGHGFALRGTHGYRGVCQKFFANVVCR